MNDFEVKLRCIVNFYFVFSSDRHRQCAVDFVHFSDWWPSSFVYVNFSFPSSHLVLYIASFAELSNSYLYVTMALTSYTHPSNPLARTFIRILLLFVLLLNRIHISMQSHKFKWKTVARVTHSHRHGHTYKSYPSICKLNARNQ